eukprot:2775661-Amphidinium_carterae.2
MNTPFLLSMGMLLPVATWRICPPPLEKITSCPASASLPTERSTFLTRATEQVMRLFSPLVVVT